MRKYLPLLGLAIALALAGCTKSPIGLFESIQLERKIIDDRALDNELLVGAITRAGGQYFISAGALWHRSVTDTDYPAGDVAQWVSIASPGSANYTTSAAVTFGGSGTELVYAAYTSQDGSAGAVYAVDPAGDLTAVADAASVFPVDGTTVAGIGRLFVISDLADEYLLVGVRTPGTSRYALYGSTTGEVATFALVAGTEGNLPVIDVAAAPTGEVFLLTRKEIFVDADGLNAGAAPVNLTANLDLSDPGAEAGSPDRQPEFGGVYYHVATGILWVTDNDGFLYRSEDLGATWAVNAAAHVVSTSNDNALKFTDVIAVDHGGSPVVLVGTDGHGYRELDTDYVPTTPAAETSNYQASELAQASVIAFFVDGGVTGYVPTVSGESYEQKTGNRVFVGTSNLGLWKALYPDTADPVQWVRE